MYCSNRAQPETKYSYKWIGGEGRVCGWRGGGVGGGGSVV